MRSFAFAALGCLVTSAALAQAPPTTVWQTDLEAAKKTALKNGQPVLVHFGAPWCAPCNKLENEVFNQPGFEQAISSLYVPVKLNCDNHPELLRQWGVDSVPTDVILSPQGQVIAKTASPLTLSEYLGRMNQIAQGGRSHMPQPGAPAGAALAAAPMVPPQQPPYGAAPPTGPAGYAGPPQQPAASPYAQQPPVAPGGAMQPASYAPPQAPQYGAAAPAGPVGPQPGVAPPGMTGPAAAAPAQQPLGLDGYCAVTLCEKHQWVAGNREWGVEYRGRIYLFATPEAKQKFWDNPDRYAPVASGVDPVLAIEQGRDVPGQRAHGVFFENRIYLFADEASLDKFRQAPDRYAAEIVQARR